VAMGTEPEIIGKELRTPRAAAVAGVAFSLLLGASLVLIRISVPADPSQVPFTPATIRQARALVVIEKSQWRAKWTRKLNARSRCWR